MAKKHTFTLTNDAPKKNSVVFKSEKENQPLTSIYLMRDPMKKLFGVKNLDKLEEVEITISAKVQGGDSKKDEDEEEEDEDDE